MIIIETIKSRFKYLWKTITERTSPIENMFVGSIFVIVMFFLHVVTAIIISILYLILYVLLITTLLYIIGMIIRVSLHIINIIPFVVIIEK